MIQKFNKDFVFAINKNKNIMFNMDSELKLSYLRGTATEYELLEEYGNKKIFYKMKHIINVGETPIFYIEAETEIETHTASKNN